MTPQEKQPKRPERPTLAWTARQTQQQKADAARPPVADDAPLREEPGYGHGV